MSSIQGKAMAFDTPSIPRPLSSGQARARTALERGGFFKLIGGGSLTDADKVIPLALIYAEAGADCVDLAPDLALLNRLQPQWEALPTPRPMVMVSLPLDPDPHFRKIDLIQDACIDCLACLPVCPTEAITYPEAIQPVLQIDEPRCYGCGRCEAVCPTQALVLHPFQVEDQVRDVLSHPLVEAVEIHTRYADPLMLTAFLERFGEGLRGKALALCFRPPEIAGLQWWACLELLQGFLEDSRLPFPLILQIDGQPMSGSDHPAASLPALESARQVRDVLGADFPFLTISGGINVATAGYLTEARHQGIRGVGMGTMARRLLWSSLDDPTKALSLAHQVVQAFQTGKHRQSVMADTEKGRNGLPGIPSFGYNQGHPPSEAENRLRI